MDIADPKLPPMLTGHALRAPDRPLAWAAQGAAAGRLGAADFVWSRDTSVVRFAIVLEPPCSLMQSFQMAALIEVALAEALGAVCPPQVAIGFRWPGEILINGARAGCVQFIAPAVSGVRSDFVAVPPWIVVGAEIVLRRDNRLPEPGHDLETTALWEEGGGEVTRTALIEAVAPRILAWIHTWQEGGFRPIAEQWLFWAEGRKGAPVTIGGEVGHVLGRDDDGGLMFRPLSGQVRMVPFAQHVVWHRGHSP